MTDREVMQEAWETLNMVLAPFPVDDQLYVYARCTQVAKKLQERLAQHPRQASEDLRARTTGNRPLTTEQMCDWVEETWQRCQDEAWAQDLQIGDFTLTRYDLGYWLAHKNGDGMQVSPAKMQTAMDLLWQDF